MKMDEVKEGSRCDGCGERPTACAPNEEFLCADCACKELNAPRCYLCGALHSETSLHTVLSDNEQIQLCQDETFCSMRLRRKEIRTKRARKDKRGAGQAPREGWGPA